MIKSKFRLNLNILVLTLTLVLSAIALPAFAHHPMDGKIPSNLFEGFISGLAHPVIGLDHLAFIIATGCFATLSSLGLIIPTGFVIASLIGTAIHLMSFDLPYPEAIIALTVLVSGTMLAQGKFPPAFWIIPLAIIGGIFHGFAYAEAIIGAQTTPLVSYLIGFSLIQWLIAFGCYKILTMTKNNSENSLQSNPQGLRFVGFTLFGIGLTFLTSMIA